MSHSDFYFILVYLCGMDRMVAGTLVWAEGETANCPNNVLIVSYGETNS